MSSQNVRAYDGTSAPAPKAGPSSRTRYNVKKTAYGQRDQKPLLVMLRESNGWTQEAVVCIDTRDVLDLCYTIRESVTGKIMFEGNIQARADSVTALGSFEQTRSEAVSS